ncbi:MAG: DMT family transporter [Thermodesulfobacteriota bacterium]
MELSEFKSKAATAAWMPYLLLATAPLCWGGNIVLARGVAEIIPPISFAFWRWTVALMLLLPFSYHQAGRDLILVVKNWKIMGFLSLTGIAMFNTLLYSAVHTTTAINGALIQTAMPAVIILISLILFNEKVRAIQIFGVVLCMLGAVFVVIRGEWSTVSTLSFAEGDIMMIVAVVLYALYSVFLKRKPQIHPVSFLVYTFGIGALGLLPFYVWELNAVGSFQVSKEVLFSILYVSLFPSIVAYFCWNRGIELIGANQGGLFINLIPVFASILAVILLGESVRLYHVAGMMMIFTGMMMFNRNFGRN